MLKILIPLAASCIPMSVVLAVGLMSQTKKKMYHLRFCFCTIDAYFNRITSIEVWENRKPWFKIITRGKWRHLRSNGISFLLLNLQILCIKIKIDMSLKHFSLITYQFGTIRRWLSIINYGFNSIA